MSTVELSSLANEGGNAILKQLDKDILELKEKASGYILVEFIPLPSVSLSFLFSLPPSLPLPLPPSLSVCLFVFFLFPLFLSSYPCILPTPTHAHTCIFCQYNQIQSNKQELLELRDEIALADADIELLRPVNVSKLNMKSRYQTFTHYNNTYIHYTRSYFSECTHTCALDHVHVNPCISHAQ